jgi:peptidoglycan/xylan/chitin deacetylase (PgdA/CDA1 family)
MKKKALLLLLWIWPGLTTWAQNTGPWKGKKCAVVLTYDDGLNVHLTNAIPLLDSLGLKATFYIANSTGQLPSQTPGWRAAAAKGHELGNHTLHHPCAGGYPGREFVKPASDLRNYTVARMKEEILTMNTLLSGIDGKQQRTFAYPCGDRTIHDTAYIDSLQQAFIAARGVTPSIPAINKVDLYNIPCYGITSQPVEELIELVKQAEAKQGLLVFLFHGVGGEYLSVPLPVHRALLHYLKQEEKNIWIAPMVEVAAFIRQHNAGGNH